MVLFFPLKVFFSFLINAIISVFLFPLFFSYIFLLEQKIILSKISCDWLWSISIFYYFPFPLPENYSIHVSIPYAP